MGMGMEGLGGLGVGIIILCDCVLIMYIVLYSNVLYYILMDCIVYSISLYFMLYCMLY